MRAAKNDEKRENTDLLRSRLTPSRIRMAGTDDGHPENIYQVRRTSLNPLMMEPQA